MTRHELKEQVQHDAFTDTAASVFKYSSSHRATFLRWGIVAVLVMVVVGAAIWYSTYRRNIRQQDLAAAFEVISAPVGAANQFGKTFPTEDAKRQASLKALSNVVAKDGDSREGLMARYYLGTMKAQQDAKGAESDLKAVADSSSESAALAKVALAQLYSGQNRVPEAQQLLNSLVNRPTALISKSQAQILLAQLDQTSNPQRAREILQAVQKSDQDPAVTRAASQLSVPATK